MLTVCADLSINGVESPSLVVSSFAIIVVDDMNGADSQRANKENAKNQHCIDITNTH